MELDGFCYRIMEVWSTPPVNHTFPTQQDEVLTWKFPQRVNLVGLPPISAILGSSSTHFRIRLPCFLDLRIGASWLHSRNQRITEPKTKEDSGSSNWWSSHPTQSNKGKQFPSKSLGQRHCPPGSGSRVSEIDGTAFAKITRVRKALMRSISIYRFGMHSTPVWLCRLLPIKKKARRSKQVGLIALFLSIVSTQTAHLELLDGKK